MTLYRAQAHHGRFLFGSLAKGRTLEEGHVGQIAVWFGEPGQSREVKAILEQSHQRSELRRRAPRGIPSSHDCA